MGEFHRYIGVDYSGAATPSTSLRGLQVAMADGRKEPVLVPPPRGPKKYWTRRGIAEWLLARLREPVATLVGIDHSFSFPVDYFRKYGLGSDWQAFLEDFHKHWPTDDEISVDVLRETAARTGKATWRRMAEKRARAKSVFHFDVPGSVAKSTHAGLPWLLYLRRELGSRIHFWPYDGWEPAAGKSVVLEAYPSLWNKDYPVNGRTADGHDAWVIAEWLRTADLRREWKPLLSPEEREAAAFEGWIIGMPSA